MGKFKPNEIADGLFERLSFKNRELPAGFEKSLSAKLEAVSFKKRTYPLFFRAGFVTAGVILIFLAGFMSGTLLDKSSDDNDDYLEHSVIASAEVMTGESVTIKLVYDSENDVDDVDFSISLPEGLAFNSSNPEISSEKSISWSGKLKKGRNEIPFVVKALTAGTWQIDATAEYDDGLLSHEIVVRASAKNDKESSVEGGINV